MGVAVPCTAGLSGVPPFGSIAAAIRLRRPPTIPNASAKSQIRMRILEIGNANFRSEL